MEKNYTYGIHSVEEAINSGNEIDKIFVVKGSSNDSIRAIVALARKKHIPYILVPQERLDRITRKNHQGVICFFASISFASLDNLLDSCYQKGKDPVFLMLDGITDVRNFGAIARTAECTGVDGIIVPFKGAAQVGPDAMKTSSGALNHIPVCRVKSLEATVDFLIQSGLTVFTCTEKTNKEIYDVDFTVPSLIVMGSEEKGIQGAIRNRADHEVKIPMKGRINSLNVSVATAVILYELTRQRV